MAEKQWYYSADGAEQTAIMEEALKSMLASGILSRDILVWTEGMAGWARASSVPALSTPAATAHPSSRSSSYSAGAPGGAASAYLAYASFGKRFVAMFIDSILLQVLYFFTDVIFGIFWGMSHTMGGGTMDSMNLEGLEASPILMILKVLGFWIYFAAQESSSYQATLGKRAMGIIVTDSYGDPVSFGKASIRVFGKLLSTLIFLIGYFMAAFTERKQALHDLLANTLVIDK
ncbi:MAG: RDD family protein [Candidatus Hydrogenedens sp.]|nr:RDD family protein [Candidatus Hydrogenedens sp.]